MKRTMQLLGGILVVLVIVSGALYATMISPLYREIEALSQRAQALETESNGIEQKLANMPAGPASPHPVLSMLRPGDEALALKRLYAAASGTTLMIEALEVLNVFNLKGPTDESSNAPQAPVSGNAPLPQLDENGMPVGAMTDDSEEDPGIEVLPIRLKLRGTVSGWGEFIHRTEQTLGLSGIRTMRMAIADGTIAKGTVEFVLPLGTMAAGAAGNAAAEGEQR